MSEQSAEQAQNLQASSLARCTATTVAGEPCKAAALPGKPTCLFHSPEAANLLKEAQRRGGLSRAAQMAPCDLGTLNWGTPAGIIETVTKAADALLAGRLDSPRAKALADMGSKVLAALGDQLLHERLAAIEKQLEELREAEDETRE